MKVEYSWVVCAVMFLLFLLVGGSWAACGCKGSSKVYIQYKPPVSGWYTHSQRTSSFKRDVTVSDVVSVSYYLTYTKSGRWILLEKSSHGKHIVASYGNKYYDQIVPLIRIFCPAPKCGCQGIAVGGASYLNGIYYRGDNWELFRNLKKITAQKFNFTLPKENLLEEMKRNCRGDNAPMERDLPFSNLVSCIRNDSEVLSGTYEPVTYIRDDGRFNLTQAPEGDFWWFEADDGVFAASKEGSPCPANLPAQTQWLIVNLNNKLEVASIPLNVTCVMDEAFSECSLT